MKDYYADFLIKNSENIPKSRVSKVSKVRFDGKNKAFDTFVTEPFNVNHKSFSLYAFLENSELREQFEFEVEERTAIMIFDGRLAETEAVTVARDDVEKLWTGLFADTNSEVEGCPICRGDFDVTASGQVFCKVCLYAKPQ